MSRWGIIDKSIEGRQSLYFPHFTKNAVPLKPKANEQWRFNAFSTSNYAHQKELRRMCKEDALFWMAGFGSVFDAGDESGVPGRVSSIPAEFQVDLMTALWAAVYDKRCQVRVPKPRRMRATWSVVATLQHCWQFMGERHLLVGSHREEEVDGSEAARKSGRYVGEWSKLLPKFDYMQIYQPKWLLPNGFVPRQEPYRSRMKLVNPETGAIIWGTSASSKTAHGERGWAAYWDEAALTENLYDIITGLSAFSPCKIWTSTIYDLSHPFSTILKDSPTVMQVKLHWTMNPEYTEGLTVDEKTGKPTSPWFERRKADLNFDQQLVNRVLEADETVQVGAFYGSTEPPNCLTTMFGLPGKPGTLRPPVHVGEMVPYRTAEGLRITGFVDKPNGRWKLWVNLEGGTWPEEVHVVWGADVAAGGMDDQSRGKSNSVLVLLDHRTKHVVGTFVTHGLLPYEFAELCAASLRWIGKNEEPFGNFENNGPGSEFGDAIRLRMKYGELYSKPQSEESATKRMAVGRRYGWHKSRDESTRQWFAMHRQMICEGKFVERDEDCAVEMREFQDDPTGVGPPVYLPAMNSPDPSGARENHGDRVIGRIVALIAAMERPYEELASRQYPVPGSSDWFELQEEIEDERGVKI